MNSQLLPNDAPVLTLNTGSHYVCIPNVRFEQGIMNGMHVQIIASVKMKEHARATFLSKNLEGSEVTELVQDQLECIEFQHDNQSTEEHNNQTIEGHNNQTAEEFNN